MFNTTIYVNEAEIKRRLGNLADRSGRVIARAVNRAYPAGRKAVAQEASRNYLVTQTEVNDPKTLKIIKAAASNPTALLEYSGGHRNLYLWNRGKAVSPNRIIRWAHGKPNVQAYSAAITRGHSKIKLNGEPKPFIQRVRKGENSEFVGMFRRKSISRNAKLVGVGGPAIPQILKNEKIMEQFRRSAGDMLQKRLEHEIEVMLKGVAE